MKTGWIIDGGMFPHYRDQLLAAIQAQGHTAKLIQAPSPPYRWDDVDRAYRDSFPKGACVVAHGDIELVTRIQQECRWTPGAFCTVENFFCSKYSCWLGEFLLNRDYVLLPFGELSRCKDFLFRTFGGDGRIFIRPDSPLKLFTGQIANSDTFSKDLEFMGFYEFPPDSLVLVSSPKKIVREWRFVVANGKIIAGSQYKHGDELDYQPHYDLKAFDLAQHIAAIDYNPDPAWVLDICKTQENTYHLLEIGGFSFADLYACDMNRVVAGVSAAAKLVWEKKLAG